MVNGLPMASRTASGSMPNCNLPTLTFQDAQALNPSANANPANNPLAVRIIGILPVVEVLLWSKYGEAVCHGKSVAGKQNEIQTK